MIDRVSGRRMRKQVPCPIVDWISMEPRSASMLRRTTSMPTPRPDRSVTCSAVEKPASKISAKMPCSSSSVSAPIRPRSMARARIFAAFRPRPSSLISSTTEPDSW